MRVNMDSSIVSDPRFGLIAKDLGVQRREIYGACYLIWLCCYERRSPTLSAEEIDLACEIDGMASSMVRRGIAHEDGGKVSVHGVPGRIKFLEDQAERGRESGRSRRKSKQFEHHDEHSLNQRSSRGSTYTLTPATCSDSDSDSDSGSGSGSTPTTLSVSPTDPSLPGIDEFVADRTERARGVADDIREVFEHYRRYHPRAYLKPSSKSKEWRHIAARLAEGSTVQDICEAIDGCHRSEWHMGQNDRGRKYDSLELIVRDGSKVEQFRSVPALGREVKMPTWAKAMAAWAEEDEGDGKEAICAVDGSAQILLPPGDGHGRG